MTASDLLHKVLDYYHLWNSPQRKNSKPSQSRLLQIEKLLKAFDISPNNVNPGIKMLYSVFGQNKALSRIEYVKTLSNLSYFSSGHFLVDKPESSYTEIELKIKSTLKSLRPALSDLIDGKPMNLEWLFNDLFRFRQEVYKLTYPNPGMLEGFVPGLEYSFYLQGKLKESIIANAKEIDELLCSLIDPQNKTINKDDIDYPDFDLESIDLEWRMENY